MVFLLRPPELALAGHSSRHAERGQDKAHQQHVGGNDGDKEEKLGHNDTILQSVPVCLKPGGTPHRLSRMGFTVERATPEIEHVTG